MVDLSWKILLIEDDKDDYFLVKSWLSQVKHGQFDLTWIENYKAGLEAVKNGSFDVVLVDYRLDTRSGVEFIQEAIIECGHMPFILLTGVGNYELDVTAMEAGASDYLSKTELNAYLLERSIRYAIERKRAEQDLHKAYDKVSMLVDERTEELIETRRKLIESVDVERKRLAQEIHDGPIQDLLGITYLMIGKANSINEEELLVNMQGAISQVVDSLREICKELRTSSQDSFNLGEAIRSHAEDFRRSHPELALSIDAMADLVAFPERSRLALYRIYQQAMANIAFHAKAKRVGISVTHLPDHAVLEVEDDGGGFIVPSCLSDLALKGHFGLVGSLERAVAVGGQLEIDSRPGKGTVVKAIVPIKIKEQK